jgi:hypothetical protein
MAKLKGALFLQLFMPNATKGNRKSRHWVTHRFGVWEWYCKSTP